MTQTLYLSVLAESMTLTELENPAALASIELVTNYAFDSNVQANVQVTDYKNSKTPADPLSGLVFSIIFKDKVDGRVLTQLSGGLYMGGGVEALEENHANDFNYIMGKLDFYGALNGDYDFFESVTTTYAVAQAAAIKTALEANGVFNNLGDYRIKSKLLDVPASTVVDATVLELRDSLLGMKNRPNYIVCCEIDSLPNIEVIAEVMSKINCHGLLDVGELTDWRTVTALVESISINDHRFWVFWNPNKSRPSGSTTVLARKKWRPCVGDHLGQLLLRNARTNSSGIPPINRPIAGYGFPLSFRDMEALSGVMLNDDEEAQNALAEAGVNVVMNERFEGGDRWVYADALTQYNKKTSALRLTNAAEIETYTTNLVLGVVKKHLLKNMSSFVTDANDECSRKLDACATAGLLLPSSELGGLYYALQITQRGNSFEKADVQFSRRPEGCARQVILNSAVTS